MAGQKRTINWWLSCLGLMVTDDFIVVTIAMNLDAQRSPESIYMAFLSSFTPMNEHTPLLSLLLCISVSDVRAHRLARKVGLWSFVLSQTLHQVKAIKFLGTASAPLLAASSPCCARLLSGSARLLSGGVRLLPGGASAMSTTSNRPDQNVNRSG